MKVESEEKVGQKICDLMYAERKSRKVSQQKLCENLGVTQGLLSKIENGKLKPSVYVWLIFCKLFGISPDIALNEAAYRKRMAQLKKSATR